MGVTAVVVLALPTQSNKIKKNSFLVLTSKKYFSRVRDSYKNGQNLSQIRFRAIVEEYPTVRIR